MAANFTHPPFPRLNEQMLAAFSFMLADTGIHGTINGIKDDTTAIAQLRDSSLYLLNLILKFYRIGEKVLF